MSAQFLRGGLKLKLVITTFKNISANRTNDEGDIVVLMEWTSAFSVDIESIDTQHKKLLGYMNTLYDALTEKKDEYTKTHFTLEEKYFDKFNYKGKDAHVIQHKEFIRRLGEMKKQITEDCEDVEDLLEFLVNWLIHHIKGTDHMYVECFHEHGVK